MGGLIQKLAALLGSLYSSKEADDAVKASSSMGELVGKLIPVAVGLIIAGAAATNAVARKAGGGGR